MSGSSIRVYVLARELDVPAAEVLARAQRLGFAVPNQLSTLDPKQRAAIEADFPGDPPQEPGPGTAHQVCRKLGWIWDRIRERYWETRK